MATIRVKSANLLRRDTASNWTKKNPVLREGEEGYETDTGRRKIGDGTTEWNNLKYNSGIVIDQTYNPESENAQSGKAVAEAVTTEQNRADNTFANALKGSKSGSAILIDDVSPVTREMSAKISSDTVEDLTAVKVSRYGKNLFDKSTLRVAQGVKNLAQTNNGFTFETASTKITMFVTCDIFLSVGTYYCRGTVSSSDGLNGGWGVYDPIKGVYIINNASRGTVNGSFAITESKTYSLSFFANYSSAVDVTMTFTNIQLELGTTATDYEPYITPTDYTPNADGTVNGITSLYPNTTLMTDTEGVIIDCEYNRDINKAFAALEAAIATNNS